MSEELLNKETEGTRYCTTCLKIKPLESFYKHPMGRKGRTSRCRPCYMNGKIKYKKPILRKTIKHRKLLDQETKSTKYCSRCLKIKSLEEFKKAPPSSKYRKGTWSMCSLCFRDYQNKRNKENPSYSISEKTSNYRQLQEFEEADEKACSGCMCIRPLKSFRKYSKGRKNREGTCLNCIAERNRFFVYVRNGKSIEKIKLKNPKKKRCEICCSDYEMTYHHWNYDYSKKGKGLSVCTICHKIIHLFHFQYLDPIEWHNKLKSLIKKYDLEKY